MCACGTRKTHFPQITEIVALDFTVRLSILIKFWDSLLYEMECSVHETIRFLCGCNLFLEWAAEMDNWNLWYYAASSPEEVSVWLEGRIILLKRFYKWFPEENN